MPRHEFAVPIFPYLKKYVEKKIFNGMAPPPFKVDQFSIIGKQFMSILIDHDRVDCFKYKLEMSETLRVHFSKRIAERSPRLYKLMGINFYIDSLFKEDLISWNLSASFHGIPPFTATKNFLAHYGIDESEYSTDSAYRYWLRWKNLEYQHKGKSISPRLS
jgi:hypothetical protein